MRKVTEYINSQLDRSALNSFDQITAKFDPKKIEAAITMVLGREGLYETYYYEALMEQIIQKLENNSASKSIVEDLRYVTDIYDDLPDYESIKDTVNNRYGEAKVEEIVNEIDEQSQDTCLSDGCQYDCGSDCGGDDSGDSGYTWEEAAKEEATKQAEQTADKDAVEAVVDTIEVPGEVTCSADAYSETEKTAQDYQNEFLEGADPVPSITAENTTTGETVSYGDIIDGNAPPGEYTLVGINEDERENVSITVDEDGKATITIDGETYIVGRDENDLPTVTEANPGNSDPGSNSPGNTDPGSETLGGNENETTEEACTSDEECDEGCPSDTPCDEAPCDGCSSDCGSDCGGDCSSDCSSDCPSDCSSDCPSDGCDWCSGDCGAECPSDCPGDYACVGDCGAGDCGVDCGTDSCGCDDCDYCSSDCGCDDCDCGCDNDTGCGCDDCGCDDAGCGTDE